MKAAIVLTLVLMSVTSIRLHRATYDVQYQWGGNSAPWNPGNLWIIGDRSSQAINAVNIKSDDGGATLKGTIQYAGEGPIGFKADQASGNNYQTYVQWGGSYAPWNKSGKWIIGERDGQRIIGVDVKGDGQNLSGTVQYKNEGPIGFKANKVA